eukprot:comp24456_c0_seq1/m.46718 comp24456_c0_seq1/g.46718  ORF comp24456_c0_seq1/g.46718 comp24456_c0_seq1/m.46718 type:complete len:202 (-) comp24456_c0_seq1:364-969(-)
MNSLVNVSLSSGLAQTVGRYAVVPCAMAARQAGTIIYKRWAHKQTQATTNTPTKSVTTNTNSQAVAPMGDADKFDQAFAAIFVTNFRTANPVPKHVSAQQIEETLSCAESLGISKTDVMYLFEDNVKWNLDRLTPAQLSEVSWSLFQVGEEASDLQASILQQALKQAESFNPEELNKIKYVNLTGARLNAGSVFSTVAPAH